MTNMHFNTAYEEVAVEQGEQNNNKLRSNNGMVQSKLIYMIFAFVFAVILVQGVVLYFVLKSSSSSTGQQSLSHNSIIKSACKKSPENIPTSFLNSSANVFGITVDTSPLISKIESTLTNYEAGRFGREIRYRPTDQCLHGGLVPSHDYPPHYKVFPATCDHSSFQQWRKVQHQIHVGKDSNYLKHGTSFEPCLACANAVKSCALVVHPCHELKNSPAHNFTIRIYQSQIDLVNGRVYFSIHNELYSTQCLGLQYNANYKANVFHLQECTGSYDQSFYLEDADLSAEIDDMRTQLSSYLASMLVLDSSGKQQNCQNN